MFCSKSYRLELGEIVNERILITVWACSLLLIFTSSVVSDNPIHSLFASLHWFLLSSILCFGFYIARRELVHVLLAGLLILQSLMVLKALLFLLFEVALGDSLRAALLYPGVEHHRFFNQVQVFIVPLLYLWAVQTRFRKFAYFFLFANLLLAFSGGARGLLVGLIGGAVIAGFLLPHLRREVLNAGVVTLFAALAYLGLSLWVELGKNADVLRAHTSGRLVIWQRLIEALEPSHFVLGQGTESFSYHSFNRIEGHPHNSVLQFLYEWGLLATLGMIAAVGRILWLGWQKARCAVDDRSHMVVTASLLVALVSAAIYSLFSGVVVMPIPQTLFFLFLGLLWGAVKYDAAEVPEKKPVQIEKGLFRPEAISTSVITGVGLGAVLVVYVHFCGAYLAQQAGAQEEFRAPRFWAQGAQFRGLG
ncbi:hypothetical protein AWR36_000050 [Microbulbifer flavimaris]|uniref:O-antigen ligase-related domain-containing protein n=2 Tax=Microbulbiferaceae TaxID=1706373 RepID=A0ABX4I1E9_9GAMM|nr:hypothetical protein AWR36_000050 [Microbulbifer flavimaris]